MSPAAVVGTVLVLLALLFHVVAFHGQHLARLRWDHYYRRAAVRSERRRQEIGQVAYDRRLELGAAQEEQRRRHNAKYVEISRWGMEFNNLLHETRGRR